MLGTVSTSGQGPYRKNKCKILLNKEK